MFDRVLASIVFTCLFSCWSTAPVQAAHYFQKTLVHDFTPVCSGTKLSKMNFATSKLGQRDFESLLAEHKNCLIDDKDYEKLKSLWATLLGQKSISLNTQAVLSAKLLDIASNNKIYLPAMTTKNQLLQLFEQNLGLQVSTKIALSLNRFFLAIQYYQQAESVLKAIKDRFRVAKDDLPISLLSLARAELLVAQGRLEQGHLEMDKIVEDDLNPDQTIDKNLLNLQIAANSLNSDLFENSLMQLEAFSEQKPWISYLLSFFSAEYSMIVSAFDRAEDDYLKTLSNLEGDSISASIIALKLASLYSTKSERETAVKYLDRSDPLQLSSEYLLLYYRLSILNRDTKTLVGAKKRWQEQVLKIENQLAEQNERRRVRGAESRYVSRIKEETLKQEKMKDLTREQQAELEYLYIAKERLQFSVENYQLLLALIFASSALAGIGFRRWKRKREQLMKMRREDHLKQRMSKEQNYFSGEIQKILYPHQINMVKQNKPIEETMPTTTSEACMITFDVQNSSGIGLHKHHEFFEAVIKHCHMAMHENYNEHLLSSNAYMVKEMGDGFLCSVGFPFQTSRNIHEQAFLLAQRFFRIFSEKAYEVFKSRPVYCSIGIATGSVTGFFPKTGLKQYDLYGHAIVQSTRYENFRKRLFQAESLPLQDIIILQSTVAEQLPPKLMKDLICYQLKANEMRNDNNADCLYYYLPRQGDSTVSVA